MVVSIWIVQAAVQTAMKVTPAMRAKVLSAHPALNLDVFPAGVTDPHGFIIHRNVGECKGEGWHRIEKLKVRQSSECLELRRMP